MLKRYRLEKAVQKGNVFKVNESFFFAVNIPDDSVGCSGSRCSNCSGNSAYCDHVCRHCGLPFVGPFGFPQLPEWKSWPCDIKMDIAEAIYNQKHKRGRIEYGGIKFFPLNPDELTEVENLDSQDAQLFFEVYHVYPRELRKKLLS